MSFIFLKGNTISMIQHLKDRELSLFTLLYSHHPFFLYRWSLLPTANIFSQRCSRQNKVIDNDWRISLIWADFLCSSILQSVGSRKFLSIKIDTPGFSVTICVRNILYGLINLFWPYAIIIVDHITISDSSLDLTLCLYAHSGQGLANFFL